MKNGNLCFKTNKNSSNTHFNLKQIELYKKKEHHYLLLMVVRVLVLKIRTL